MADLARRLDEMEALIRKPSLRGSGGRANEVNYWIFDYPPEGELEEGEMRLYSEGGAEIKLLNNGTVEINGQIFERKEG